MCLTSPATVVRVEERGGITVVTVLTADESVRACLTYVEDLKRGDRVSVAGGAIVERFEEDSSEEYQLAQLFIDAFDATHKPTGERL